MVNEKINAVNNNKLIKLIEDSSLNLDSMADTEPLFDKMKNSRIVLLGESTHGTHEFYTWRTKISKKLIEDYGFSFIAVEADWPDAYSLNRYIKQYPDSGKQASEILNKFNRWPTWVWANWEVNALIEWLNSFNKENNKSAGFYGLDLFSLRESMEMLVTELAGKYPEIAKTAREAFTCFEPYINDVRFDAERLRMAPPSCEKEAIELLKEIRSKISSDADEKEMNFEIEQNARAMYDAEEYYMTMIRDGKESWNLRERHMAETLDQLLEHHGANSKAIIWAHNSHIGDARAYTKKSSGSLNFGEIVKAKHLIEGVFSIGFGSNSGELITADEWGAPMKKMNVENAKPGSWENLLHGINQHDKLILLDQLRDNEDAPQPIEHRSVGLIYNPASEEYGYYSKANIQMEFDAFIFIDETSAVHPLKISPGSGEEPPETYPWGL